MSNSGRMVGLKTHGFSLVWGSLLFYSFLQERRENRKEEPDEEKPIRHPILKLFSLLVFLFPFLFWISITKESRSEKESKKTNNNNFNIRWALNLFLVVMDGLNKRKKTTFPSITQDEEETIERPAKGN